MLFGRFQKTSVVLIRNVSIFLGALLLFSLKIYKNHNGITKNMLDENFFGWSPDDARELFVRLHVVEEPSKLKEMQAIYKYIDLLLPFISTAALVSSMQLFLDTGGSNNVDDNYLPTVVRGLIPISIVLAGIIDLFIENTCIYIMISQFLVDGSFSGIISNIGGYATFLKWVFALYLPVPSSLIIIWVNQQHGNKEKIS